MGHSAFRGSNCYRARWRRVGDEEAVCHVRANNQILAATKVVEIFKPERGFRVEFIGARNDFPEPYSAETIDFWDFNRRGEMILEGIAC